MNDNSEKIIRDLIDNAEEITVAPAVPERHESGRRDQLRQRNLTQTDVLIQLAAEAAPFHAPDAAGYVDVEIGGHRQTWPIRSETCNNWLRQLYFEETDRAANPESLKSTLDWLEAQAKFKGPEQKVHVRVARHEGNIYLDLGNKDWQAVEITPEGWSIIDRPPVRFRRPAGMRSLPIPSERGSLDSLKQFLNVSASGFVLVVAYLLTALRGRGPYWVLAVSGEHGAAKSTSTKIVGAIIDPHGAPLRSLPRDERDLFIAAANGHLLAFDNVSELKPRQSDALCRIATGGTHGTRLLYTDQDEALISALNPVILNGIEEVVVRQDLADRTIRLLLDSISDDRRLPEDEFWARFKEELPGILGALLDALVCGLKNYPKIAPKRLPRMADCAKFVMACEPALWPIGTFEKTYAQNRDEAVQLGIEADPVASAIVEMAMQKLPMRTLQTLQTLRSQLPPEGQLIFAGTATDLNQELRYGDELIRNSRHWPKLAHFLSGRLKRMAPALREWGIRIEKDFVGRKHNRMINIYVDPERFMKRSYSEGEVCPEDEVFEEGEVCKESEVELESEDHDATPDASPAVPIPASAASADMPKAPSPEQPRPRGISIRKPPPRQNPNPSAAKSKGPSVPSAESTARRLTVPKPKKPTSGE